MILPELYVHNHTDSFINNISSLVGENMNELVDTGVISTPFPGLHVHGIAKQMNIVFLLA